MEIIQNSKPKKHKLDPKAYEGKQYIFIKGAKVNNLKDIDIAIPRNKLIVVTGVSGSGKSSLAFDTLFAEGQRMYVESLSSYARQFLGRMEKPDVEYIKGISPAIAVEQKVNTRNPRSTVGTTTEIYDYMKLLFARIGVTYSPISGEMVKKDTVSDVVDYIESYEDDTKFMILAPLKIREERSLHEELKVLLQKGFTRIQSDKQIIFIESLLEEHEKALEKSKKATLPIKGEVRILIDRGIVKKGDEQNQYRIADSVQTAFFEGEGDAFIEIYLANKEVEFRNFSDRFEADGMQFEEPNINFFSFNSPYGACRRCEGFGTVLDIDPNLVIPDQSLSVYEGAIAPWRSPKMQSDWLQPLIKNGIHFDFPVHRSYEHLTEAEQQLLWEGNEYFKGLDDFFAHLAADSHKIQARVMLARYRGRRTCPDCRGTRIRKDASYVKIQDHSITDLVLKPIDELAVFFDTITLSKYQEGVAKRIFIEIKNRLHYLLEVGLGYLTLNRKTATLSGGEFQRIKLATSLGSALVGSMYILDEPSIGLHPRDTQNLIRVLKKLRDLGNTVIVVEHEEELMREADQIIDIGPDAGIYGGHLMFQGTPKQILKDTHSHTARYLNGTASVAVPQQRRKWKNYIEIKGARANNLKNIDVKFPLGVLTAVTGVSGSGKSTLVRQLLYPALSRHLGNHNEETGDMTKIGGKLMHIHRVEMVDQNPIGKSSRSNPVTYIKAYDAIRDLYSQQSEKQNRLYKPGMFSFNVEGGRCETCQGDGTIKIEMQFMADIYLTCEECQGKRFKEEVLEIKYKDKDISEVLAMSVDESLDFFAEQQPIINRLRPLQEVGLGYIRLGQSSNTLSGGEAQRVKLASFLGKNNPNKSDNILFVFDEPTTGLHFHDIAKLLKSINALIEQGHSAIIIEHNVEVIKSADWVIDMGPEGGKNGGTVCFAGLPEELALLENNHTGQFLKQKLIAE
ncbi:MAG: excinuclease ABC subunit UvrA [Bernardetiaceae bacterium]|nr:excinuclease ABC subunit UvrA [Bernardetiaceae bacterium]